MRWLSGLGLTNVRVHSRGVLRLLVLVAVCLALGLLVVDYGGGTTESLQVGDVASRTVKAPRSFTYEDTLERSRRRDAARRAVLPVYVHQDGLVEARSAQLAEAFRTARAELVTAAEALSETRGIPAEDLDLGDWPSETRAALRAAFRGPLSPRIPDEDVDVLLEAGFPDEARAMATALLREAGERLIIADRDDLPTDRGAFTAVPASAADDGGSAEGERVVRDLGTVAIPEEVRRDLQVRAALLRSDAPWTEAALRLARAHAEPNLAPSPERTQARRERAVASVPPVRVTVKRGTVLFRDGEELDEEQIDRYQALQAATGPALGLEIASAVFFVGLLVFTVVYFGASNLRRFSLELKDLAAIALLVVGTAVLTRIGVGISDGVATLLGYEAEARAVWFAVPVAAAAMLVRLLVSVEWAVVTGLVVAAVCGLLMDLDALMVLFAFLSSLVAAGAVDHTRERMSVLRAGLITGVANAAVALLVYFLGFFMGEGEALAALSLRPAWSMGFALLGGLLSSVLVLGLMPVFERAGFVTDYRLMELANLNHPLMRQLMLRAPGSYHHSVVVGSLAEAACEAVGANALQTRVAAYFHDIGKSLKPQYFVENQGSGGNKHAGLDPYTSAGIIISHVTDGAELARKHRLPQPCIDNIYMHHGTGLLQYFYAQAVAEAGGDESRVDESAFRYPGPRPDSREAGILMLADKVEAATRTIAEPSEEKFRSMIHAILNSVMADNQFEHCPLTFQELYTITDAMVGVLMGIHHQRIEYPQTAHLSAPRRDIPPRPRPPGDPGPDDAVITLEIPSQAQLRSPSPVPGRLRPPAEEHADGNGRVDAGHPAHGPHGEGAHEAHKARQGGRATLAGGDRPQGAGAAERGEGAEERPGDYEAVEHLPGGGSQVP
jgi:cyclic-di-AMP phosphodiesterase PgpH